jgi:MoaA/NifB/PqqE/SkfB family radical SAM enzyme
LITNGILFTPENWGKIANVHYAINFIRISIDAAARETYEKLRRGGNFDILLDNLEFISGLKRQKNIKLQAAFVMQKENYREMPMFVELVKKYNFDMVHFGRINNWGTYTDEEFRQIAVHRKDHPEHKDFLEILKDPALRDPIVGGDIIVERGNKV